MNHCKLFIFIFLISSNIHSFSQNDSISAKNSVFAEIGGNGLLYSANLDRILFENNKIRFALRVGYNYFPTGNQIGFTVVPSEISFLYNFAGENNFFEFGTGITWYKLKEKIDNEEILFGCARIGYRYQPYEGGIFFKAGFTPTFILKEMDPSIKKKYNSLKGFIGLGIGYTFRSYKCFC